MSKNLRNIVVSLIGASMLTAACGRDSLSTKVVREIDPVENICKVEAFDFIEGIGKEKYRHDGTMPSSMGGIFLKRDLYDRTIVDCFVKELKSTSYFTNYDVSIMEKDDGWDVTLNLKS